MSNKLNDSDDSLDIILPITIIGSVALGITTYYLYYYCYITRTTISLDDADFFYNELT